MSLIGKIAGGAVVGAELLDIIRYTSTPIESLGVRPDYGDDGTGWGIVPIPEEPVDPGKLEFGIGLSPVIIFGKGEVCVGANVGIGYEVKFLACHRNEPVEEPAPVTIPPPPLPSPFTIPPPPPADPPSFPPDDLVCLIIKEFDIRADFADSLPKFFEATPYFEERFYSSESDYVVNQVLRGIEKVEIVESGETEDLVKVMFLATAVKDAFHSGGPVLSNLNFTARRVFASETLFRVNKKEGRAVPVKVLGSEWQGDNRADLFGLLAPIFRVGKWKDLQREYQEQTKNSFAHRQSSRDAVVTFNGVVAWEGGISFKTWDIPVTYRKSGTLSVTVQATPYQSIGRDPVPPPSVSLPLERCQDMSCCNKETDELVRLIARCLGVTATGYFMELPKSMIIAESGLFGKIDASETVRVKSQAEFNAYLLQALSAISGQFEVTIDVPARVSKATKGEAERIAGTITIPDLANGLAIITKLLLNLQDDEGDMRSFLTRILLETHLSRRSAARAADEAYNLRLWTGMKVTEEPAEMPCTFSPPKDIAGKDIDQIDTDAEVRDFLRESNVPYKRIKYSDKAGFKEIVHQLLQGVAILRAVFGIRFDSKSSTKDQMKSLVRQTHSNAQGKPAKSPSSPDLSDDDFRKFVKEEAKQRGIKIDFVGEKK